MLALVLGLVAVQAGGPPKPLFDPEKCIFSVADYQYVSDPQTSSYRDRLKIWLRLDPQAPSSKIFVLARPDFSDPAASARYNAALSAYLSILVAGIADQTLGVEPTLKAGQTGDGRDANPYVLGALSFGKPVGLCEKERKGLAGQTQ